MNSLLPHFMKNHGSSFRRMQAYKPEFNSAFHVVLQLLRFAAALAFTSLAGCQLGPTLGEPTSFPTQSPEPVFTESLPTSARTEGTEMTFDLEPTAMVPAQSTAPTATAPAIPVLEEAGCKNQAEFIQDLSIPDGTDMSPHEQFVKSWRLRNTGTCTWSGEYAFVFTDGDQIGAYDASPLPETVQPGETVDLSIAMTAPGFPGTYQGYWLLQDELGNTFGIGPESLSPFWVQIDVKLDTTSGLATPMADTPAAGICGESSGEVVTMTINPDMPDPRCMAVRPDQRLRIINRLQEDVRVLLGQLTATIPPDGEHTLEKTFGEMLLPGVHALETSHCCGGTIWLKESGDDQ